MASAARCSPSSVYCIDENVPRPANSATTRTLSLALHLIHSLANHFAHRDLGGGTVPPTARGVDTNEGSWHRGKVSRYPTLCVLGGRATAQREGFTVHEAFCIFVLGGGGCAGDCSHRRSACTRAQSPLAARTQVASTLTLGLTWLSFPLLPH
jgi:hypothetical protein